MATRVPARLSAAARGRKFGLTLGAAFLTLAAVAYWRHAARSWVVLATLGTALLLAGLVVPARLDRVERAWLGLAHLMSKVTTPLVMSALYFLVITPVGWVRRTAAGTPMRPPERNGGFWAAREPAARRGDLTRQF